MDVKLPDGTVIQGVPDGMSKADLAAKLKANGHVVPDEWLAPAQENPATSGTETYFDIPSMSFKQRPSDPFVAGVGKAFVDTGRGLKQLAIKGYKAATGLDLGEAGNEQDIANSRELDKPLTATTAGKVGQAAGGAAMLAAAPEGLLGATAGGAALSGAQPTVGDESRGINAAIGAAGGAAGLGAGKVAGAIAQPVVNRLNSTFRGFLKTLESEGVPTDLAQSTGSKVATTLKNAANDSPLVSTKDFQEKQAAAFTKAALSKMGVSNASEATPAVMAAGKKALKDTYNAVADRNGVELDGELAEDWDRIRSDALSSLTPEHAKVIANKLDDILTMMERNNESGVQELSGTAYQKIQSSLGQIAKDGGKAPFVTDIRRALTDAMQRQAKPGDAALLSRTNQRYAAMKAIEKSIGDDNQVSPAKLFGALDTAKGANQTVYGEGANQSLIQLAQAGKAVIGKSTPNSGTAQRLIGAGGVGAAGVALYDLAMGKPVDSGQLAEGAIAAGFAPAVAKQLAYSPAGRKWLTKWASSQIAAGTRRAVGNAGAALGGGTGAGAGLAIQQPSQ